jgi:sialidase-1
MQIHCAISIEMELSIMEIISQKIICKEPGRYIGWPTIAKTCNGRLIVAFSGNRDQHVCPFGVTQIVCSDDSGRIWSLPETINDTPLDDRDAGIIETAEGTLLLSWFTSEHFAHDTDVWRKHYGDEMINGWQERINGLGESILKRWLGSKYIDAV